MKTSLLKLALATFTAAIGSQAAFAQALDYDSLSELFGEPVTAGATGAPQRASDVPATMVIITREEIGRFPEYDIPGILRHYAGMDVMRYSFGDAQVSIRGAATGHSPRLLVLVDGRSVYLDSYGYTAWSTLPVNLEDIQQIEVVKGPQSALYGFNAVAGVVNIITRDPDNQQYAGARTSIGTGGYSDLAASVAGDLGERVSGRISYGRTQSDPFNQYGGEDFSTLTDTFQRENVRLTGRAQLTETISAGLELAYSDSEVYEASGVYSSIRSEYEVAAATFDLEADTNLGLISVTASRNETDIVYIGLGPMNVATNTLKIEDIFKIGASNTIRLSVEYRDSETSDSFPTQGQGALGYDSFAASAMWNHKISAALDLTIAGRFDSLSWSRDGDPDPSLYLFSREDYSVTYEEFSYNGALVWRPEFGGTLRLIAGRGIQTPAMFDFGSTTGFSLGAGSLSIVGDPNMVPSVVTNYEVAYDRALTDSTDLRVALFRKNTQDIRGSFGSDFTYLPPEAPALTFAFQNRGDTALTGFEAALSGTFNGGFDWDANYTYQNAEDDLAPFPQETPLNFEASTPEHLLNARLGWSSGAFTADGFLNYTAAFESPQGSGQLRLVEIDEAVAASFRASYALSDQLAVSATAQNVTYGGGTAANVAFEPESRFWVQLSAGF